MSATTASTGPAATIDQDLDELSSLLWETIRGLKQASPPPQELRDAAERSSLGPRHMPALLAVAAAGPLSVSELARRLGLGLSTTSAIVGQLSRAGLLERAEDETDRRRTIVRLHDDYGEAIGAWVVQALAPLRGTLERLSPDARAKFMEGWRLLHEEAMRTASADEARGDC
ncbi:MAG: helix-turn-helix domain-containing protein [Solirubrobacteraceae bacterium]|jgi:DNA-binding MarR family transcriptional regulator